MIFISISLSFFFSKKSVTLTATKLQTNHGIFLTEEFFLENFLLESFATVVALTKAQITLYIPDVAVV